MSLSTFSGDFIDTALSPAGRQQNQGGQTILLFRRRLPLGAAEKIFFWR